MTKSRAALQESPTRVLYVVYWGLLEPLGQSLVLPAVLELSRRGIELSLISYEKPHDSASGPLEELTRARLADARVAWTPLRYHKRPRLPATLFDVFQGWLWGVLLGRRHNCDVVHARTFVGGLVGLVVSRLMHSTFVYHNEGFYADEQVDSGVWHAGSAAHRVARWLERRLYSAADGIITLSSRAAATVRRQRQVAERNTPVAVVPSCVDLERFTPPPGRRTYDGGGIRLVYSGSLGGRYRLCDLAAFVAAAASEAPGTTLTILSWAPAAEVQNAMRRAGVADSVWTLRSVDHAHMPHELATHDAGLHFTAAEAGGAGGSPTKIGEYWACGLPVVATTGIGDLDEIIRAEHVGALVHGQSARAFHNAASALRDLLRDRMLPLRCRHTAEKYYSLERGCAAQLTLYGLARARL